jgi:LPS-assembly lipoprotein
MLDHPTTGAVMQRRFFLLTSAAATALSLSACGFALRKAPDFSFSTLYSAQGEGSALGVELKRNLESSGKVKVISDPTQIAKADVVLDVLNEQRERVVVGLNAAGQVREFQLRIRFKFRLRTPGGREIIPDTEILQQRDISFNESAVLSKEPEEALLYRSMQNDIVQQLMRRLSVISLAP